MFRIDHKALVPSREVNDGVDYVPTRRAVIFGHHFTSIAGTGPIVGPAIAVFWGWLPALIWVLVGSILIGAVHDFGALMVSLRSRGQTIGDVAGRMISKRARLLFLLVLFCALTVVIAIFGLVIAVLFSVYPQSVLSVWIAMPIAVALGFWMYRRGGSLLVPSLIGLGILYFAVYLGAYHFQIDLMEILGVPFIAKAGVAGFAGLKSAVVAWTGILLVYCFVASVLPVWVLLQPRDYINSHQLFVALVLLLGGLAIAHPELVAPAINASPPADAPPLLPFLFITVACGAISGFHCLVSSGTTSKQIENERDALYVGYGSMLLEGGLAVIVILACCAGIGMGVSDGSGGIVTGSAAWLVYYGGDWEAMSLAKKVGAFVQGGGNMIAALGIPLKMAIAIVAVMVCCFAATTLDTATRLQRYIIQELSATLGIGVFANKYAATLLAVVAAGALALVPAPNNGPGSGGLILWPLFGTINQLLAGLSFMVIAFYLVRHRRPVMSVLIPAVLLLFLPAWAMFHQLNRFYSAGNWLLFGIGIAVECLHVWMIVEGVRMWGKAKGVKPAPLPKLRKLKVV